jgi:type II secretory pathway pseudopilin PulG
MRVRAARFGLAALAAALAMALVSPAVYGDEGWIITSFQSDLSIGPDSTLTVREDIRADFGSQHHHGIFRTIPTRYRFDDTRDRYYGLQVESVTDGSKPVAFQLSGYDNVTIKIGNPDILVSGPQRYVITYIVQGAMNSFSDHDELFWNVDGALWPVPKAAVAATVHLPANAFQKAACYEGQPGSTEACRHVDGSNLVSYSSTRQLGSGEEMSIVTALNKGAVTVPPPMLEPRRLRSFPQDAFDVNPLTVGIAVLVLVAGIAFVVWNWLTHGRDRAYLTQYYLTNDPKEHAAPLFSNQPVVVEFEPPQNLRPAELGLILDERADPKDLTATIVDLAVRGFLTIAEVPGKKDWVLTQARNWDPAEIMPYENTILGGLFAGRQQVTLSDLRGTFTVELSNAELQMNQDAMSRKWFSSSPQQSRAAWGCLGIGLLSAGIAATIFLGLQLGWGLIGVAVVIVGIVMTISFPFMTQRTAAGRDLLQHTLGFRLYMTTAEKYRQQFAAKADIFTQLLPYAIVFGTVTLWAKAFEGIDTSSNNNWYVGPGPFQAALLAGSLQSMNTSISSAIAFTPSGGSASGFGAGGFSGGGGGGGGGGSW